MARRPPTRSTYVYFIQAETLGLIKIGCAVDPSDRLYTLQCGSPDQLKLLAVIRDPNAYDREKGLHHHFRAHQSHGEWFRPAPEVLAYIAANAVDYDELLSSENAPLLNAIFSRRDAEA